MDISAEVAAIQAASQGSELRQPLVGALNKLNTGSLPAVTASDAGKILKVGANGWEVGEKSGYMPVPTATMQITENGTHDVTNYAAVNVSVSSGGGGGKNILNGVPVPSNSIGVNGDIYIQYLGVPTGYTRLEYIESDGTQWIDTDIPARQQLKIVADLQFLGNSDQTFIGGNGGASSVLYLGGNPNDRNCIYINYDNNWNLINNMYTQNRHVYESSFLSNKQTVKIDDTIAYSNSSTISGTTATDNLCVFARSNHNNTTTAKLYELKIYDALNNMNLIGRYIPASRNSDSAIGLYDIINDVFYDSDGTNAFISGQSVSKNEIEEIYLKVNNQWGPIQGADISDVNLG